jgi:hypothetical protein
MACLSRQSIHDQTTERLTGQTLIHGQIWAGGDWTKLFDQDTFGQRRWLKRRTCTNEVLSKVLFQLIAAHCVEAIMIRIVRDKPPTLPRWMLSLTPKKALPQTSPASSIWYIDSPAHLAKLNACGIKEVVSGTTVGNQESTKTLYLQTLHSSNLDYIRVPLEKSLRVEKMNYDMESTHGNEDHSSSAIIISIVSHIAPLHEISL